MSNLYADLGGYDVLLAVVREWHARCLADPVAAHPFHHVQQPMHDERLAAYLAEITGGPRLWSAGYGDETAMRRVHAGNGEHDDLDARGVALFAEALAACAVPTAPAARLAAHFEAVTVQMRAYAAGAHLVPDDLPIASVPGAEATGRS